MYCFRTGIVAADQLCPGYLGECAHPLMPTLPCKANNVFVAKSAPPQSPAVTAGGGRRSAAHWDCRLGMSSPVAVPAAAPGTGKQPSGNSLLEVLVKMQWALFGFFFPSPVIRETFFDLQHFSFRRVPFLTLKISKPPKAAVIASYVPQRFLKLLPSSVLD